jgi:hypothetical protein
MIQFTAGAITICYWVGGLFFLRFWKKTQDRLFLIFGAAFWILALNRIALTFTAQEDEAHAALYIVRLVAYLLILGAILDKNRKSKPK